jgi:hypothetical protein
MPLQIKTIKTNPQSFAVLIKPDLSGKVKNDQELYAAINTIGKATIAVYQPGSFETYPNRVIDSDQFERDWQGD